MKKIIALAALFTLLSTSCQKKDDQLTDRIAKLEKRIELLEKRLTAVPAQPPQAAEQTQAYDIPVGKSFVLGNPNAPITLSKFTDFQCPFCARAHETFVEKIFEDPELKDKVKVVFKHFPLSFHQNAKSASKAALAAGEQGSDCFWKMTKLLYNGQRELSEDNYKKWASEVSCKKNDGSVAALDATKFWNDYKNKDADYEAQIAADIKLGTENAAVRGTPSFYLNGWKLGQRSVEAVKSLIAEKALK
jgi:protein-disulfide isomerase